MFCISCGSDISENDKVCPNCGHIIGAPAKTGYAQVSQNETAPLEKRIKAFVQNTQRA